MPSGSNHSNNHATSSSSGTETTSISTGLVNSLRNKGKKAIERFDSASASSNQNATMDRHHRDNHQSYPTLVNGAGVVRRGSTGSNLLLNNASASAGDQPEDWTDRLREGKGTRSPVSSE